MPLFSRREPVEETRRAAPVVEGPPRRSSTLFGRKRDVSPVTTTSTSSPSRHSHSVLHRNAEDASITSARERVLGAEAAERDADKALMVARQAVREAREQVKRLEREAAEEARLATIKMKQAGEIGKRGKMLGRHDRV